MTGLSPHPLPTEFRNAKFFIGGEEAPDVLAVCWESDGLSATLRVTTAVRLTGTPGGMSLPLSVIDLYNRLCALKKNVDAAVIIPIGDDGASRLITGFKLLALKEVSSGVSPDDLAVEARYCFMASGSGEWEVQNIRGHSKPLSPEAVYAKLWGFSPTPIRAQLLRTSMSREVRPIYRPGDFTPSSFHKSRFIHAEGELRLTPEMRDAVLAPGSVEGLLGEGTHLSISGSETYELTQLKPHDYYPDVIHWWGQRKAEDVSGD